MCLIRKEALEARVVGKLRMAVQVGVDARDELLVGAGYVHFESAGYSDEILFLGFAVDGSLKGAHGEEVVRRRRWVADDDG